MALPFWRGWYPGGYRVKSLARSWSGSAITLPLRTVHAEGPSKLGGSSVEGRFAVARGAWTASRSDTKLCIFLTVASKFRRRDIGTVDEAGMERTRKNSADTHVTSRSYDSDNDRQQRRRTFDLCTCIIADGSILRVAHGIDLEDCDRYTGQRRRPCVSNTGCVTPSHPDCSCMSWLDRYELSKRALEEAKATLKKTTEENERLTTQCDTVEKETYVIVEALRRDLNRKDEEIQTLHERIQAVDCCCAQPYLRHSLFVLRFVRNVPMSWRRSETRQPTSDVGWRKRVRNLRVNCASVSLSNGAFCWGMPLAV